MNRQAFGSGEQLIVGGNDAARKITRRVEHAGAAGPEQSVGHLAAHALEALVENGQLHTSRAGAPVMLSAALRGT